MWVNIPYIQRLGMEVEKSDIKHEEKKCLRICLPRKKNKVGIVSFWGDSRKIFWLSWFLGGNLVEHWTFWFARFIWIATALFSDHWWSWKNKRMTNDWCGTNGRNLVFQQILIRCAIMLCVFVKAIDILLPFLAALAAIYWNICSWRKNPPSF